MSQDASKRRAATAALSYIKDGVSLGVGTGSTVDILIELLQPLAAKLGPVVSSSERSTRRLAEFGIRTVDWRRRATSTCTSMEPTKRRSTVI